MIIMFQQVCGRNPFESVLDRFNRFVWWSVHHASPWCRPYIRCATGFKDFVLKSDVKAQWRTLFPYVNCQRVLKSKPMNPPAERTITQEKLHWGIIIPGLSAMCAIFLMSLPALFFLNTAANFARQSGPQAGRSKFGFHWWIMTPLLIIFILLLVATAAAYFTSEIALTNKRLIFRTGLLSRRAGEVPLNNVESIFIIEPFIGRLCGFGTVAVTTVGGKTFPFQYLRTPHAFHAILQETVAEAKNPTKPPAPPLPPPTDDSRYMPKP